MKKFIHNLAEFKFITALYFMSAIMLGSIGCYINGLREFSFVTIWELMGMSIVFGALHYIQMSHLPALARILVHGVLSYITVIAFSLLFGWGFSSSADVILQFTVTFLAVYFVIFLAFSLYYKNEQTYLNKKLEEYKQKNK